MEQQKGQEVNKERVAKMAGLYRDEPLGEGQPYPGGAGTGAVGKGQSMAATLCNRQGLRNAGKML